MITITLLVLIILSIFIGIITKNSINDFSFSLIIGTLILFIVSLLVVLTKGYEYNKFKHQKEAIEQTINYSRENNINENYTVTEKIIEWNSELSKKQYQNTIWILDEYIDDRIMDLKPIK
jgi:preprotein translocase subunit SecF